jgi:hypothetical protein
MRGSPVGPNTLQLIEAEALVDAAGIGYFVPTDIDGWARGEHPGFIRLRCAVLTLVLWRLCDLVPRA